MKKMRKGKKMLLIILAVVLLILAIVLIVNVVKNREEPEKPIEYEEVIPLPDTTYSEMEVTDIHMQYLKDQDKTILNLEIHNTSGRLVENEHFNAILIGPDENVLGEMPTWFDRLDVGEECDISVILAGDLTATTRIKLMEI